MPIRAENRKRYPPDWPATSRRIRHERAERRCECEGECGLHKGRRCEEYDGEPACWANGIIVLTVAHLNHQPEDCRDENLKAMCQRCHNRYDAPERRRGIRERRLAGQQNLELDAAAGDAEVYLTGSTCQVNYHQELQGDEPLDTAPGARLK